MSKKSPWKKKIKITKRLKFDFEDLLRKVDIDYQFTLHDVLRAVINSNVPLPILRQILHCNHLEEYWDEINSRSFEDDGKIEYLEVYWLGDRSDFDGESNSWAFHGVGFEGSVSDHDNYTEDQINQMKKDGYRESWAIEFSPLYTMSKYHIKIKGDMVICNWGSGDYREEEIKFRPSITLVELLYAIFWELSFCGSQISRNNIKKELDQRSKEIEEAIENGTIDKITTPFE